MWLPAGWSGSVAQCDPRERIWRVERAVNPRPIRALVVDDDNDIGEMVRLALVDEGYDVEFVQNGAAALDASQAAPFDVILLDMRMPLMDGWAFAQAYRSRPGPHVPMIVVTAAQDAAARAAEIDADGYLAKPFSLDELFAIIERHVRRD
jgi:DNA-binding response OmpR family regulator